jgi:hypothetical protein
MPPKPMPLTKQQQQQLSAARLARLAQLAQPKTYNKHTYPFNDAGVRYDLQIQQPPKVPKVGFYNFENDTTVYCFSDIESNMPPEIKNLMFSTNDKTTNIDYTPIDLLSNKKAIVFTGDLIDRGAYTVRNLLNMLKLKNTYQDNVILICGNRDINKIRMYHECYIEDIDTKILKGGTSLGIVQIIELLKGIGKNSEIDIFDNSGCEISASINIRGIVNPPTHPIKYRKKYDKNFKNKYRDDIYRIVDIYTNTLGSPNQIEFFNDEFKVLFKDVENEFVEGGFVEGKYNNNNDEKYILLLKFIAMMNMVMGKNNNVELLPKCFQSYNGLYINYLEKCHIISQFTIGNNNNNIYIASHSGIPYKKATNTSQGFFYIPSDVGIEPTSKLSNNISNIADINKNFNDFIKGILDDRINYTSYDFKKYVAMGASCLNTVDSQLTSLASPIVSSLDIHKIREENRESLRSLNIEKTKTNIYNIFGHQPSGLTPQINKVKDEELISYHIDLDISKAENANGISNQFSSVYLTLKNSENRLVGNIDTKTKSYDLSEDNSQDNSQDKTYLKKKVNTEKIELQYDIQLDKYCDDMIIKKIFYDTGTDNGKGEYVMKYDELLAHMFLIDKNYYGMFGYDLIKLPITVIKPTGGGASKKKTYTKSVKRFMNGKKQMVIYLGKRGGEYLKVKGEYISIVKYRKTANKKKTKK